MSMEINRYRLAFETTGSVSFSHFPGSAFRGVFGRALKAVSCLYGRRPCEGCLARTECVYPVLFESQVLSNRYSRSIPNPLIFDFSRIPSALGHGERFTIDFTLLGDSNEQVNVVFKAWEVAGKLGIGSRSIGFEMVEILEIFTSDDDVELNPCAEIKQCRIRLITPFCARKRIGDRRVDIGPGEFETGAYLLNIVRRRSQLERLYGTAEDQVDVDSFSLGVHSIEIISQSLERYEYKRKSFRQDQYLNIHGVVGEIDIAGDALAELFPILWLGQWLHVGNNTIHGCGKYEVVLQ